MDQLDAALHSFRLYLLIARFKCGNRVIIEKLGVYAKDNFDFTAEQKLGFWKKPDKVNDFNNGDIFMTNASFRGYRDIYLNVGETSSSLVISKS